MKTYFSTLLLALLSVVGFAQNDYQIETRIKGVAPNQKAYLAMYLGGQLYKQDSATATNDQKWIFKNSKPLNQGLYALVSNGKPLFDFVITENQHFSIETDTTDFVGKTKVKNSDENTLFFDYQKLIKAASQEVVKIRAKNSPTIAEEFKRLDEKIKAEKAQLFEQKADMFVTKFINATTPPEIPQAPTLANGRPDSVWQFYYYKNHYWDNFDFTEKRLVYTPVWEQKMHLYLDNLTLATNDSIIKSADELIKKALDGKNRDMIANTISGITNKFENSRQVGIENVFVYLLEKYYLTGLMPLSDSATTLANVRSRIKVLKPLMQGKVIPDLGVLGTEGKMVHIHDNPVQYKVLYFYSPSCGHCRTSAPQIRDFYEKHKLEGVDVMTVCIDGEREDWQKFIKEFKWESLSNGYGREVDRNVDYHKEYEANTTPTIYVIDENQKIIARKITVEDLEPLLNLYKQQRKKG